MLDSARTGRAKFTGKPVSQTTGLYYYYHRWYDPSIGRFISLDPKAGSLANPQSLNPYSYVRNCPCTLTDPSGEGFLGSIGSFFSPVVRSVANTINQLGSAAVTLTTKALNVVVSATISTAKTLVTANVQLVTGATSLGQTTRNALVGPIIVGTTSAGGSTSGQGGGSSSNQDSGGPLDTLNSWLDILPPCAQVIVGGFVAFMTPVDVALLLGVGVGGLPESFGASLALVFAAGEDATWQPIIGGLLLARGGSAGRLPG